MEIETSLAKSMDLSSKEPTQEMYKKVLLAIAKDARRGESVNVPVQIGRDNDGEVLIEYGMAKGTDNKHYYIICTNAKELNGTGYDVNVVVKLSDLLNRSNNDTEVGGICINPWSSKNCFIPNEYIEGLLRLSVSSEEL